MPCDAVIVQYLMAVPIGEALELGRGKHTTIKGAAHDVVYHALLEPFVQRVTAHQIKAVVFETALAMKVLHAICVGERCAAYILHVMVVGIGQIGHTYTLAA